MLSTEGAAAPPDGTPCAPVTLPTVAPARPRLGPHGGHAKGPENQTQSSRGKVRKGEEGLPFGEATVAPGAPRPVPPTAALCSERALLSPVPNGSPPFPPASPLHWLICPPYSCQTRSSPHAPAFCSQPLKQHAGAPSPPGSPLPETPAHPRDHMVPDPLYTRFSPKHTHLRYSFAYKLGTARD